MYAARQDLCSTTRSQHRGGRVDKLWNLEADGMREGRLRTRKMKGVVVVHGGGKRQVRLKSNNIMHTVCM